MDSLTAAVKEENEHTETPDNIDNNENFESIENDESSEGQNAGIPQNMNVLGNMEDAENRIESSYSENTETNVDVQMPLAIKEESVDETISPDDSNSSELFELPIKCEMYVDDTEGNKSNTEMQNVKEEIDANNAKVDVVESTTTEEELMIKSELDEGDNQQQQEMFENIEIKIEPEISGTDTDVMVKDMIGHNDDNIPKDSTESFVLNVLPTRIHEHTQKTEEILPNCDIDNSKYEHFDTFQLNSITSDMLPLEQQAFGLIETNSYLINNDNNVQCPKCPKICRKNRLKHHLNIHDTVERRRQGVLKGLQTKANKRVSKEHYDYEKYSGRGDFSCMKCGKHYVMKKSMLRHQRNCLVNQKDAQKSAEGPLRKETEYLCTCGKTFGRRTRMETCLRSHNFDSVPVETCISCFTCTKAFKDKAALAVHKRKHHTKKKRYPCKFCPTDYNTPKELFKHLRKHQRVQLMEYKVISEVVKGEQELNCFMCNKTCKELSELKVHVMGDHKEPYTCAHCHKKFPNIIDFASHTKTLHPEVEGQSVLDVLEAFSKLAQSWKCEECELQFEQPDKLAMHQAEQHMSSRNVKSEGITSEFQCIDCSRVFMSFKQLSTHRRMIHNHMEFSNGVIQESIDTSLMCVHCRKICKDENALTSHMRLHSPERRYVCKFCNFRFATIEKRKTHAVIHTGEMKYVCFICEYRCSSENRLNLHKLSEKHIRIKESLLSNVPLVREKFPDEPASVAVERDLGNSSDCEINPSTCNVCGDIFTNESKMLEHKQSHPFIEFPNDDQQSRIFFK